MMRLVLLLSVVLFVACANGPRRPALSDTFQTSGGAHVQYARCKIDVLTRPTTFQFQNVRLEQAGKVRLDPTVRFDKPGLAELTSSQAKGVLYSIDNLLRDACVDMRDKESTRAMLAQAFYDRGVKFWFDVALRFESLRTEEEFQAEIISSHAQFEELLAEREAGYVVKPAQQ